MTDAAFDALMASLDPPLVVLTTAADGERAGCLVGFHTQSAIGPRQVAVCLSKANHTYRVALRATRFAVHFLGLGDLPLAARFGTRSGPGTFTGVDVVDVGDGVPLLRDCPHRAVIERLTVLDDGGDHVLLTARVLSARTTGPFVPLRVSHASHLTPGHSSDERAIHP